jgi:predicted alpha/beta superfamily hydrolase
MRASHSISKALLLFALLLAACSPTAPSPTPVVETVILELPVTVQVTRVVQATAVVEVPSEQAAPGTGAAIPRTEVRTLVSSVSGQEYRISVALPLTYGQDAGNTYPVVYLLDANMWFGMATEITRLLYFYREELPEVIVVGIGYTTDDPNEVKDLRLSDLTPTQTEAGTGQAEQFLQFLQKDVIPSIEARYRADPVDRTLVGQSLGGLFALYVLFHAPETFQRYVVCSPSLWWDGKVAFDYEEEFATQHSDLPAKLFLSVGELEEQEWLGVGMVTNVQALHQKLEDRNYAGLEMDMAIMAGETHSSAFPGAFTRGLKTVFH